MGGDLGFIDCFLQIFIVLQKKNKIATLIIVQNTVREFSVLELRKLLLENFLVLQINYIYV
jgi:hypothetical protein